MSLQLYSIHALQFFYHFLHFVYFFLFYVHIIYLQATSMVSFARFLFITMHYYLSFSLDILLDSISDLFLNRKQNIETFFFLRQESDNKADI